jgi:hypothetical protein
VLPCPVPYDNKIELQIAPPADAQRSWAPRHENFGVRELALAFTAQRPPRPSSASLRLRKPDLELLIANDNPNRIVILSDQRESKGLSFRSLQLKPSRSGLLIANLELEFLASRTKLSLLTFSNRKKIAVFDPAPSPRIGEPKKLSPSLASPDDRCRCQSTIHPHISNRNSRFIEFRSTYCKQTSYRISNRDKNADSAFLDTTNAAHESPAASHELRTTTRAAFRSTIPARPHGYR